MTSPEAQYYVIELTGADCTKSKWDTARAAYDAGHAAALATVAPAQPRVLTTAAELDALPHHTVAIDADGDAWQKLGGLWGCANQEDSSETSQLLQFAPFTPLTPVPVTTEPVLLTADDPRWRDGAKVRGEYVDGTAAECIIHSGVAWMDRALYGFDLGDFTALYLLAEAPDPDAKAVAVLAAANCEAWSHLRDGDVTDYDPDWYRAVLADIRAKGYDVTKRES